MSWFFFALLASLFWAMVNLGDKYAVVNRFKSPYVFLSFTVYPGVLFLFFLYFVNWNQVNFFNLMLVALGAAFYFYGSLIYIKAVQIEEITRINILMSLIPFFSLFLSFLFIGEKLTGNQLFGFLILIFGGILSSLHYKLFRGKVFALKPVLLMLLASFFYGAYGVVFRFASFSLSFWDVFIIQAIFMVLFSLSLFFSKKYRKSFKYDARNFNFILVLIILFIVLFDFLGMLFNLKALSLQTASLVNATVGFQAIFVFLFSILISFKNKEILKESWDNKNTIFKISALVVMVIGVLVLNLG